jgi:hypothetical protein
MAIKKSNIACVHRRNISQYDSGERCGPWASCWVWVDSWQTGWWYRDFYSLIWCRRFASSMAVAMNQFIITNFYWAVCCRTIFIPIVRLYLAHWLWHCDDDTDNICWLTLFGFKFFQLLISTKLAFIFITCLFCIIGFNINETVTCEGVNSNCHSQSEKPIISTSTNIVKNWPACTTLW